MPPQSLIFWPVLTLAAWTFLVLLTIPICRFTALAKGLLRDGDYQYEEGTHIPAWVRLPNLLFMNLLEVPVLFYVVALLLFVTRGVDALALGLAWGYVALRLLHGLIYVSYNAVMHRFLAFAISNVVVFVLWVRFGLHLLALPPV
jgi:hypothetical protein